MKTGSPALNADDSFPRGQLLHFPLLNGLAFYWCCKCDVSVLNSRPKQGAEGGSEKENNPIPEESRGNLYHTSAG